MPPRISWLFAALTWSLAAQAGLGQFTPAVAVEAEDFTALRGWKVVQNGEGNHISGERLLSIDASDSTASAHADVQVPVAGKYRLWVRYEYPSFCEARFRVIVEQHGKKLLEYVMGKKDSRRHAALNGQYEARPQHDPAWGCEGLVEEVVTVPALQAGKARVILEAEAQPQLPGVAARRNIDLVYLTSDTADGWVKHYQKTNRLYPLLDAFRDTRGPRWEVRFTNRGTRPAEFRITHRYNRIPWGYTEPATVRAIGPGGTSPWVGMSGQDTAHFGLTEFHSSAGPFELELRPAGSANVVRKLAGGSPLRLYVPPYPGRGEQPATPVEVIDSILGELRATKAPGKRPAKPLCYGGWMPLGREDDYGRKYAELYAELGLRSLHPGHSGPASLKNLQAVGIEPSPSWAVMGYRNPPMANNIDKARGQLGHDGLGKYLRFYDYGDEIAFSEWLSLVIREEMENSKKQGKSRSEREVLIKLWAEWLKENRPRQQLKDYWRSDWGPFYMGGMRPDSSAAAAVGNPRLYVDSLLFYEHTAIRFAAQGARAVRAALGEDVLCGGTCSCHPFYYPGSAACIQWFRGGAAELGRHSESFWQFGQAGPMVNGYIAEHFRAGMRDNPRAVLRQYTMPDAPGNTDANFLRSAFSHLAHGATMLDFFAIGLNETFGDHHIDHRARGRYRAIRDVTHAVGLVEDLLPEARAVPSPVALLVSESTERWDHAGIATDRAGLDPSGANFRKMRLHFHLERLGIWKALTFLGASPDLVIEDDITPEKLKGYRLLVLVGDHWPRKLVPAVEAWVRAGGVALSTAAAGLRDEYGQSMEDWYRLAGLWKVATEQRTTFLRPRQELPFLEPLGTVAGDGWRMPRLATVQTVEPLEGTTVLATFQEDDTPAVFLRPLGKGKIVHIAAHPGLAYLYSALTPPAVPDRGPGTHTVPTRWDAGARALLNFALKLADAEPTVQADPALVDARLLAAPNGYVLPVANYHERVGQKVSLKLRVDRKVTKVTSAYHGELPFEQAGGQLRVALPALGYGDVLRLDTEK